MKSLVVAVFAMVVVLNPVQKAGADSSFRCRGHIVALGDTQAEVRDKCGPPDNTEHWDKGGPNLIFQYYDYEHGRYIAPRMIVGPLHMARWTYRLGSNRLTRYLLFQNGELIKIDTGQKEDD